MGLLPGYDAMGIAAPVTLILLRMVQGLSVGGQLAGSYVFSIEQSTINNRGIRGTTITGNSGNPLGYVQRRKKNRPRVPIPT